MKIDDSHKPGENANRVEDNTETNGGKARSQQRQSASLPIDGVVISPRAREYQKARNAIAALPDNDMEKVREIKDRIQTGRYRIDAEKIAERMIREALPSDD